MTMNLTFETHCNKKQMSHTMTAFREVNVSIASFMTAGALMR